MISKQSLMPSDEILKNLSLMLLELNQAPGSERWNVISEQLRNHFHVDFLSKVSLIPGQSQDREVLLGKNSLRPVKDYLDIFVPLELHLRGQNQQTHHRDESSCYVVLTMGFNTQGPIGLIQVARIGQPFSGQEILALESIAAFLGALEISYLISPKTSAEKQANPGAARARSYEMIGNSLPLQNVMSLAKRVAKTTSSVLIEGESGTGKELIARYIHVESLRSAKPFVSLNCGALTETLLESELFGHERGAFTGAVVTKEGLAESAHGGTLFLDEVGEMSAGLQAKLLRFLQEGEFYRVGSTKPIRVDVRILAATNRSLIKEIQGGRFREDLYYRLNVMHLRMPALRERAEDVPTLIRYFFESEGAAHIKVSPEATLLLQKYPWPGNIRELRNVVERLRIFADTGEINVADLPENVQKGASAMASDVATITAAETAHMGASGPQVLPLDDLERIHLLKTLELFGNNKTKASKALGITVKTLYNKLHRYGMEHLIQPLPNSN